MAELINKLNVKYNNVVDECICYTTSDEATPKTISEGSYWEIKNNNTICYLGLWPTNENQDSGFHSKLKIKKNGIEYYVEKKVLNEFTITINQSDHQTIKVVCNGQTYTSTFKALAGSQFTVVVEPEVGYTAGKPNYSSGYVTSDITIFASYASLEVYYITLIPGNNQTLKVTLNGEDKLSFTSSFVAAYGDTYVVEIIPDEGYEAGLLISGNMNGTISENLTIQASDAEIKKYSIYVMQPNDKSIITINSTSITESIYNYGTSITAQVDNIPNGYEIDKFYLGEFPIYINQSEHQTIKVIVNNTEIFTENFVITSEDVYEIQIIADEGYTAGNIIGNIPLSGKFNGITRIEATEAYLTHTIKIVQPEHGKIYVNGILGNNFTLKEGTEVTIRVEPDDGYAVNKVFKSDQLTYTVNIEQPEHGQIMLNNEIINGSKVLDYGSNATIEYIEEDGYEFTEWNGL